MRAEKRKWAFHEPQGAAGIMPAKESERSSADGTPAAPSWWWYCSTCSRLNVLRHPKKSEHSGKTLNGAEPDCIKIRGTKAMKHQPWQTGVLALSVMLSLAGCENERRPVAAATNAPSGSVDKLKEQARNAVTTSKDYLAQQHDRWQKSYSDKLSEFDKRLADLKAKSSDKARAEWNKALSQLEQKKESAAQKLEQLKNAGTDRWQEFRTNAETAFADLEKSFNDTFSRFRNDDKSAK